MMSGKKDGLGQFTDKILETLDVESDGIMKQPYSDDINISKFDLVKLDIDANIKYREQNIELIDFIIYRLNKISVKPENIKGLKELNEKSRRSLENIKTAGEKIQNEIDEIIMKKALKKDKDDSEVYACNLGYFSDIGCDY